jgi:hypothetical protein
MTNFEIGTVVKVQPQHYLSQFFPGLLKKIVQYEIIFTFILGQLTYMMVFQK